MRKNLLLILILFTASYSKAQSVYIPYSFQVYQKLNKSVYDKNTRFHSSLKPYLLDNILVSTYDSLMNMGKNTDSQTLVYRKLFNEHLIQIKNPDYHVYMDFLPDFQIGKDFTGNRNTWLNTRGYQIGGTIGKKFSFYTSGFENQGRFANYYTNYVEENNVVPGQSYDRKKDLTPMVENKDWSYVTALLSYTVNKYLNVAVGHDKNFIGDGYRSLLLSDFSSPYTFLKLTGTLGNVQYMSMWTGMQDPRAPKESHLAGNRKKGAVFHYLDWNVNNRLSIGFFDAVVWAQRDDEGNKRGFNIDYINPVIFLRPLEASGGSPDNAMMGLTAKYEVFPRTTIYGQFSLDEFEAKNFFSSNGSYRNKYGYQLGIRGADLLKVKNLSYLAEFNSVKPYTYSQQNFSIINYANYNEPLAHPLGANFREAIGMLSYSFGRFDITGQVNYSRYGYDINGINYGKDIFKLFNVDYKEYGNYIGQGLITDLVYAESRISYLINPKYNLRLELGGIHRTEKNDQMSSKTNMLTFGLRSSFRNLYSDF